MNRLFIQDKREKYNALCYKDGENGDLTFFFNNFFQNFNIFKFFYEFILECNDYFGFKNGQTCSNAGDCYLGIGCECDDGFSSENCHLGREFYFFVLFCFVFLGFLSD